jgi:hypothetical protein
MGPPKFFDVSLPACHGLWTPADRPLLANSDGLVLPSGALQPSASATSAFSKLFQHFRVRGHPYGLQDALSTLRPSCSPWFRPRLRHGRKTRYGWVASPYPTGTFTLLETPSLLGAITPGLSGEFTSPLEPLVRPWHQPFKYTADVSNASSGVPCQLPLGKTQGSYFSWL